MKIQYPISSPIIAPTITILLIILFKCGKTVASVSLSCFFFALILIFAFIKQCKHKQSIILKKVSQIYIAGVSFFILSFIAFECSIIYYAQNQAPPSEADYIVILGAGLKGDTIPVVLKSRLDKAIEINQSLNCKIVVSGGQGKDEYVSEAEAMRNYLLQRGFMQSSIILEDQSTSTSENLTFSKEIIGNEASKKIVVVSNDFHLLRIAYLAKKCNFIVSTVPANTPLKIKIYYLIREYFAFIKSFFFD